MTVTELLRLLNLAADRVETLEGYASTNYCLLRNGRKVVLKHYQDPDEWDIVCAEAQVLSALSQKGLPFDIPASERDLTLLPDSSFVRLLTYIEGQVLSSLTPSEELLFSFGQAIGNLNRASHDLRSAPIEARHLFWDMQHTLLNEPKIQAIRDPARRKLVDYYFDRFRHDLLPMQHSLRHQLIHSDLNDDNILVDGHRVTGIIDFGDSTYAPLIYEVAIALAYLMLGRENSYLEAGSAFLRGYHQVYPLREKEIDLLADLIPLRWCVSVCNSAQRKADGDASDYVLVSEAPAWRMLQAWSALNPTRVQRVFREALGMPLPQYDKGGILTGRSYFTGTSLGTSYRDPVYMTGARFQYMFDELGNTYLDAYNNIPHVGHNHPRISRVLSQKVRQLNTNTRYLYPELTEAAEALCSTLPGHLHKVFFVNSGSAATDLALRMARTHTRRQEIAILENGYHGNTLPGIEVSDYKHSGKGGDGPPEHVLTLPLPKLFRGRFTSARAYVADAKQRVLERIQCGRTPAALIAEPVSGCGGQVPLAPGYLQALLPLLREHGILLLMDEVQTGFGRLGTPFWGFELHEVIPDILILGKPMGNGHPVAAVVTTEEVADSFANGMEFFSSFGGNPVSCAVTTEVLRILEDENLPANAARIGSYLKKAIRELQAAFPVIGDVRGQGLFFGIEFIDKQGQPATELADRLKEALKQQYILVGTDGPHNNVIKIKPPLCFTETNADQLVAALKEALMDH
jgi:ethanolamine-phosphate phospho-lyase